MTLRAMRSQLVRVRIRKKSSIKISLVAVSLDLKENFVKSQLIHVHLAHAATVAIVLFQKVLRTTCADVIRHLREKIAKLIMTHAPTLLILAKMAVVVWLHLKVINACVRVFMVVKSKNSINFRKLEKFILN